MLTTVEGVYKQGKVELAETPAGIEESRVLVVFVPEMARAQTTASEAQTESREALLERIFQRMEKGINLSGPPYPRREELYEERLKRFR